MNPEELLDALDPDQRAVATQVAGPLAVLAGAGTGKTRAITYRIAYGAAVGAFDPSNVLAVTFTQRAAFEMRHRLAQLGVPKAQARTFHSAALRQLRHFWPTVVGGPLPDVIPHKASLVAASAARLGITIDRTNVRDIAAEVEWAKVSMIDAAHYASRVARLRRDVPAGLDAGDMARLLDVYEDAKNERGVIDFEDILIYLCGMLQERADVASIVRKQYRSFVVDEFQDVNLLQARLLDLWLGGRHDVCVVGDVAQTIYSFTGASPDYLTGFGRKHQGARIVELTRDYRSTPQIVSLANDVLARSSQREGTVRLSSQRDGGAQVTYRTYDDDRAEAEGVAASIADLIAGGMAPHSIAVLMRTNGQSQAFEEALGARGIPVAVAGGKPFFARDDVRTAISRLRAAAASSARASASFFACLPKAFKVDWKSVLIASLLILCFRRPLPQSGGRLKSLFQFLPAAHVFNNLAAEIFIRYHRRNQRSGRFGRSQSVLPPELHKTQQHRKFVLRQAAYFRLHRRIHHARRNAGYGDVAPVFGRHAACMMIKRGLGRTVHAPARIRLASRTAADVYDFHRQAFRPHGQNMVRQHQRCSNVQRHRRRNFRRPLPAAYCARSNRACIINEDKFVRTVYKRLRRTAFKPAGQRSAVGQIQRTLLQAFPWRQHPSCNPQNRTTLFQIKLGQRFSQAAAVAADDDFCRHIPSFVSI